MKPLLTLVTTVSGWTADKTTCPVSIIIIARVLLPDVASIRSEFSFASLTNLFIGAAPGTIIDIILFEDIIFPYPILINPHIHPPFFKQLSFIYFNLYYCTTFFT